MLKEIEVTNEYNIITMSGMVLFMYTSLCWCVYLINSKLSHYYANTVCMLCCPHFFHVTSNILFKNTSHGQFGSNCSNSSKEFAYLLYVLTVLLGNNYSMDDSFIIFLHYLIQVTIKLMISSLVELDRHLLIQII